MGAVELRLLSLLFVSCLASSDFPPTPPETIVLIVADALRADHLGCYGGPDGISPNLDALGAHSVRLQRAYATAPWTVPSCTSVFTATYPSRHGMVSRPGRTGFRALSPEAVTLAERLKEVGYGTAAISGQPWVGPEFGFGQGFDRFRIVSHVADSLSASRVTSSALRTLKQSQGPVFLYLHYVDTHIPYCPPRAFVEERPPPAGRFETTIGAAPERQSAVAVQIVESDGPTDDELEYLRRLYRGAVRYLDSEIGNLVDEIRGCGRWETCLLVFTSDHGESFWEHSVLMHGQVLYEEQIRVPLILHLPRNMARKQRYLRPGSVVGEIVSLAELSPTILHAAGCGTQDQASWFVRLPLLPGTVYQCYAEATEGLDKVAAIEQKRKLISHRNGYVELYDLRGDPLETTNAADKHPEDRDRLADAIRAWSSAARCSTGLVTGAQPSERTVEQLKAMGYLN